MAATSLSAGSPADDLHAWTAPWTADGPDWMSSVVLMGRDPPCRRRPWSASPGTRRMAGPYNTSGVSGSRMSWMSSMTWRDGGLERQLCRDATREQRPDRSGRVLKRFPDCRGAWPGTQDGNGDVGRQRHRIGPEAEQAIPGHDRSAGRRRPQLRGNRQRSGRGQCTPSMMGTVSHVDKRGNGIMRLRSASSGFVPVGRCVARAVSPSIRTGSSDGIGSDARHTNTSRPETATLMSK